MEDLDTELLGQLQRWHEEDQYQRIIDAIEAIPQPERSSILPTRLCTVPVSTSSHGSVGAAARRACKNAREHC